MATPDTSRTTPVMPPDDTASPTSWRRATATASARSPWTLTIRTGPRRRIGMRSTSVAGSQADPGPGQAVLERVGQGGPGGDLAQVDAEMDDGLGDLRSDAADHALGPQQ